MDRITPQWCSWCRLCAKENPENNVNIHVKGSCSQDIKPTLKEALEKYFRIYSSTEDLLPKSICADCYSLLSCIMNFSERVERVEQMYKFLVETSLYDSGDLKTVRLKFEVSDGNRQQCCQVQLHRTETNLVNFEDTKGVSEGANLQICIKQENETVEPPNTYVYEEVGDGDKESMYQDEISFDEYRWKHESLEEEEYPFDTMGENIGNKSETFSKDEAEGGNKSETSCKNEAEGGITENKGQRKKLTSSKTSNNNGIAAEGRSKPKRKRTKLKEINCKKKKVITEDFALNVACTECGQKFDLYSAYCEHMKLNHGSASADRHWKCPSCERTIKSWYNLMRHLRIHKPLEDRQTGQCPECENRYTSIAQLEFHINYKHRNEQSFICEECGVCVKTNANLIRHMLIHTDIAPFECEVCKKKFKNNSLLKIHMDIHSLNKHVCKICGLQLNSRATLNRHFLVHSDEMQHKCDYCGRAFKRAKALKNHLLLHTGLKPYSCDFCDRTFANGSNCRSHMKKMHPDELATLEASGNKTHTTNIPKLEALKAVTKAVDNLTPVVTKFSGCFAFGKKPKVSSENDKPETSKSLQKSKKQVSLQTMEKSSAPLDLQSMPLVRSVSPPACTSTIASNLEDTTTNTASPTSIPKFDNISI